MRVARLHPHANEDIMDLYSSVSAGTRVHGVIGNPEVRHKAQLKSSHAGKADVRFGS